MGKGTKTADVLNFNAVREANNIISWLKDIKNAGCKGVVLGLSGGKDSTVVAMLSKIVWGDNVRALIMPNQSTAGVGDAISISNILELDTLYIPIRDVYNFYANEDFGYNEKALSNVAPRLRMTLLYAEAQDLGYRVIGTGNRSERYIGWCTKFGDMGCDMNPIAHLTCGEVVQLGLYLAGVLGLPSKYVQIPPADGITGKTDEDNFGFTYEQLDRYILNGTSGSTKVDAKIEQMHRASLHKLMLPETMEI